jgi:mono/diheme cytochrome c family protein
MRGIFKIGLFLLPLVTFSWISVPQMQAAESDAKALFEKRCSLCHPVSRPLSKNKSGDEWRQTVTRMKGYAGDRISEEEAAIIIDYLTETRGK